MTQEDENEGRIAQSPTGQKQAEPEETQLEAGNDTAEELEPVLRKLKRQPESPYAGEAGCQRAIEYLQQMPSEAETSETLSPRRINEFDVLERLGKGGMGEVFKARHREMGRICAVKLLNPNLAENPDIVERFRREVKAAAALQHPNIVQAQHAGEYEGTPFLVMDFVDGQTAAELLKSNGPLSIAQACHIASEVTAALEYAHKKGIVHRDIKPNNIMVDRDGRVLLLDLGLACFQERWCAAHVLDDNTSATSLSPEAGRCCSPCVAPAVGKIIARQTMQSSCQNALLVAI